MSTRTVDDVLRSRVWLLTDHKDLAILEAELNLTTESPSKNALLFLLKALQDLEADDTEPGYIDRFRFRPTERDEDEED